jgi:hypothetical protein
MIEKINEPKKVGFNIFLNVIFMYFSLRFDNLIKFFA